MSKASLYHLEIMLYTNTDLPEPEEPMTIMEKCSLGNTPSSAILGCFIKSFAVLGTSNA